MEAIFELIYSDEDPAKWRVVNDAGDRLGDGDTPREAIEDAHEAIIEWAEAAEESGC
jgi:hypothetical protein